MRLSRSVVILLCSLSLPLATLNAQQNPQRDTQAISVLAQCLAAMGPGSTGLHDAVATGTMTFQDGTTGTITFKSMGANVLRTEIGTGTMQSVTNFNNLQGYTTSNGSKLPLPLGVSKYARPEYVAGFSRMADYVTRAR